MPLRDTISRYDRWGFLTGGSRADTIDGTVGHDQHDVTRVSLNDALQGRNVPVRIRH